MMFIDILFWLFILEIFCSGVLFWFLILEYRKERELIRNEYEEKIDAIHQRYRHDLKDLWNRSMAKSYAEYEAYNGSNMRKPKEAQNYIKNQIDKANREYENARFDTTV